MAILEARLLPLIETLAEAGADWLAFEMLDGIRVGRVAEEDLETLKTIQEAVRSAKPENFRREKRPSAAPTSAVQAAPIIGDDQILWAAAHVHRRLSDALLMLQSSLDQLQIIVRTPMNRDQVSPDIASSNEITLSIHTDEEKFDITRAEITNAIGALDELRKALTSWQTSTLERSETE